MVTVPFVRSARVFGGALLAVSAFLLVSCLAVTEVVRPFGRGEASRGAAPNTSELTVVLVTMDGVRWQEVFHGVDAALASKHHLGASERLPARALMPNIHALAEEGALVGGPDSEERVFASGPALLSLPGYAEILTGRRVSGCSDNQCRGTAVPTLADELAAAPGVRRDEVAVITSWPDIGRVAARHPKRIAMTTGRHGGATRELFRRDPVAAGLLDEAANARAEPGVGDFRPDRHTGRIAARYLETVRSRFLFVALGEPDEYAHRGDYRGYLESLRYADVVVGILSRELERCARQGRRTALFVTADHGRADDFVNHGENYPESARVWLLAWGTAISGEQPALESSKRYLADLAPTMRLLAGLEADRDPLAGRPISGLLSGRR